MNSLPKQHIDSLAKPTREEAYLKVGQLCLMRSKGIYSDDEIAKKVGFHSSETMSLQLETWGLSGLLPPGKEESKGSVAAAPKQDHARKARQGGGEAKELPAAGDAAELFGKVVDTLADGLAQLDERKEFLQDGRFVVYERWHNPNLAVDQREYEELKGSHGAGFYFGPTQRRTRFLGADSHPPELLTALIGVYALLDEPLRSLVDALHPDPRKADLGKIEKYAYGIGLDKGLRLRAEQLATEVRGGNVRQGRPFEEASAREHIAAFWIEFYYERGFPYAEIRKKLLRYGYDLDEEEIGRIRKLRLELPSD
jgi:hypothetical protein